MHIQSPSRLPPPLVLHHLHPDSHNLVNTLFDRLDGYTDRPNPFDLLPRLVSFPRIIGDRSTRLSPNNKSDSSFSSSLSPSKSCSLGTLSLSRSEFDHPSITSPIARKSPRLPLSISTSNLKQRYLGTSPFSAPLLRRKYGPYHFKLPCIVS